MPEKVRKQAAKAKGEKAAPMALPKLTIPKQILIFGGGSIVLIILVVWIFSAAPHKNMKPGTSPNKAALSLPGPATERPTVFTPALLNVRRKEGGYPSIQAIRFQPSQPTRMDSLKAEVVITASPDPSRITYTYVWKVNDQIIEGATGNTLNLSTFKKRDLISVTVTPYDGDTAGFLVESPVVAIHSTPPSLDLEAAQQTRKVKEPMKLQLVSLHPDSDGVTFTLEAPIIPGMSIDSHTGKITWIIQPDQRGTIRFRAAVEDTDKTKVTKIFEIKVE